MSIAQAIIGRKPESKPTQENRAIERPLTPEELIDAVAESEFGISEAGVTHDTTGVGKPKEGSAPTSAMKQGSKAKGAMTKGKKTTGQVATAPSGSDPVQYGSKK